MGVLNFKVCYVRAYVEYMTYVNGKKVKAVCGSYSTAALRHIVLLPK